MIATGIKGLHIIDEPGDCTRYEFVVFEVSDGEIGIACLNTFQFNGGVFGLTAVEAFFQRNPKFRLDVDPEAYGQFGVMALKDEYVDYIVRQTMCNRWTALAALRAMKTFIEATY